MTRFRLTQPQRNLKGASLSSAFTSAPAVGPSLARNTSIDLAQCDCLEYGGKCASCWRLKHVDPRVQCELGARLFPRSDPSIWGQWGDFSSVERPLAPGKREEPKLSPTAPSSLSLPSCPSPGDPYLDTVTFHFSQASNSTTNAPNGDFYLPKGVFASAVQAAKTKTRDTWCRSISDAAVGFEGVGNLRHANKLRNDVEMILDCKAGVLYQMMECESCGRVLAVPCERCGSRYCPECEAIRSRWKGKEAASRIKPFGTGGRDDAGHFPWAEFTCPLEKRDEFRDWESIGSWMEVVRDTLREFYGVLEFIVRKDGKGGKWVKTGEIGGLETFHSWSSKGFPNFLPHIPVLLSGLILKNGEKIRMKMMLKPWELKRLRRIYTRRMCERFGWKREEIKAKDNLLDVRYGWTRKGEGFLYRRVTYMLRSPSPSKKVQGWKMLEGLSDDEIRLALAHFDLRASGTTIRWFGFMCGKEYTHLCNEFGVEPLAWKEKPDFERCPYCGGRLVFREWAVCRPGNEPVSRILTKCRDPVEEDRPKSGFS